MKKFIAIVILVVCSMLFAGCSSDNVVDENNMLLNRFVQVESDDNNFGPSFKIYVDMETDVMYLLVWTNIDQLGLTVLMDANGKPLLYSESNLCHE